MKCNYIFPLTVMPECFYRASIEWIPAFAGMTCKIFEIATDTNLIIQQTIGLVRYNNSINGIRA